MTWIRSLDQENPLEKEMATHSEAWRAMVHAAAEADTTEHMPSLSLKHHCQNLEAIKMSFNK